MTHIDYTTSDVARLLDISQQQVVYSINKGYLKAKKDGKKYLINMEDFIFFKENYHCKEQSKKNRGVKTLTRKGAILLKNIVLDLENPNISYLDFRKKYPNIFILPHSSIYLRYKRNNSIYVDSKRMSINEIATKYGLSNIQIRKILNQKKEEDNYI